MGKLEDLIEKEYILTFFLRKTCDQKYTIFQAFISGENSISKFSKIRFFEDTDPKLFTRG